MALRCTAHRTNGESCGNFAMQGGRVCHAHGGKAPAVRAAAARRLVEARLEQERREVQRKTHGLVAEEAARRAALQPWMEELGPHYVWDWHSSAMLRRLAAEMRRAAAELTQLASSTDGRQTPCTGS